MAISEQDLSAIGSYVQKNLPQWIASMDYVDRNHMELRERTVRIEEELKARRELMIRGFEQNETRFKQIDKRFEQMDKRFEQVDKRFEQVDKRFEQMDKRFEMVDKRFEQVDKRFESFETRFTRLTFIITAGFTLVSVLVTVLKFITP